MDTILPKLEFKKNTFSLNRQKPLIQSVSAAGEFDQASAYIVVDDQTGEVVMQKNANQMLPIASLTKIMTAVVVLDLTDSHELFRVSNYAASQIPTKIGVVPGEHMAVDELLHALLLTSANDAAEVLKEGIDKKYGSEVFIAAMNE